MTIKRIILLLVISLLIFSCDEDNEVKTYSDINVIIPSSNINKLIIELQFDTLTIIPNQKLVAFPTPFNSETFISFEVQEASKVKLELTEKSTKNKVKLIDATLSAGNHEFHFNKSDIANFKEGFIDINLYFNNKLTESIECLYLNNRQLLFKREFYIQVDEYDVKGIELQKVNTDFKYLINKKVQNIVPDGRYLKAYDVKSNIIITLTDSTDNKIFQKSLTFKQLTQNNELIFTDNDKIEN